MKKLILVLTIVLLVNTGSADASCGFFKTRILNRDVRQVKSVLKSQVRYANKSDFQKFISTYDESYVNSDGFNIETYSKLVKELWETYSTIRYGVNIKNVDIKEDIATVDLVETSFAHIPVSSKIDGILKSNADSVYTLKKIDGKWKVVSDKVKSECTSMMYGEAMNLDVKLTAPLEVEPNYEYTASLEFVPPKDTFAIASIAKDKVEYPQKPAKEVFRKMPEDNILERLFISNSDNSNEYIVASIGLTKADVCDISIKLSLAGFGYKIIRVNVVPKLNEEKNDETK